MNAPQKSIHYEQYEFQKWKSFDAETIVEMPVSLTVNGEVWISFMCTPVNLEARSSSGWGASSASLNYKDIRVFQGG